MTDTNLTCVLHSKGDMRLEETPIDEPKDGEVQIAIKSVGICGSDIHYLVNGAIGSFIVKDPMILGHETSGVVSKLGKGVKNLAVGDRVALEPGVCCRTCDYCRDGRYNLCQDIVFCATPPYHGTLRRFYCQAADFCFKIPDHVSMDEAAMIEPMAVAVHACRKAKVRAASSVLVTGAGPIGLLNLLVAKAFGATSVQITDIVDNKLALAKSLGADVTINVKGKTSDEIAEELFVKTNGKMPEITIECTGAEACVDLAVKATRPGGTIVTVGMGPPKISIPLVEAGIKELKIKGIFRYTNCYPTAIELVASGRVNIKPLVTHHFKLEEAHKAFETTRTGAGGAVKVIIDCSRD